MKSEAMKSGVTNKTATLREFIHDFKIKEDGSRNSFFLNRLPTQCRMISWFGLRHQIHRHWLASLETN
jgi:hypothetical protein